MIESKKRARDNGRDEPASKRAKKEDITPSIFSTIEDTTTFDTWNRFVQYANDAITLAMDLTPGSMNKLRTQIRYMDEVQFPGNLIDSLHKNPLDYTIQARHPIEFFRNKKIKTLSRVDCINYINWFVHFYADTKNLVDNDILNWFPPIEEKIEDVPFVEKYLTKENLSKTNTITSKYFAILKYSVLNLSNVAGPSSQKDSAFWKKCLENKEAPIPSWMVEIPVILTDYEDGNGFNFIVDPALTSDGEIVSLARQYAFFLARVYGKEEDQLKVSITGRFAPEQPRETKEQTRFREEESSSQNRYAQYIKGGYLLKKQSGDPFQFINMTLDPADRLELDQTMWVFENIGYSMDSVCEYSYIVENIPTNYEEAKTMWYNIENRQWQVPSDTLIQFAGYRGNRNPLDNIMVEPRLKFVFRRIFDIMYAHFDPRHELLDDRFLISYLLMLAQPPYFSKYVSFEPTDLLENFEGKEIKEWSNIVASAYDIFRQVYNATDVKTKLPSTIPQDLLSKFYQIDVITNLKVQWDEIFKNILSNHSRTLLLEYLAKLNNKKCVLLPRRNCQNEYDCGVKWFIDFPLRFFRIGLWDLGIRTINDEKNYNDRVVVSAPKLVELIPTHRESYPYKYRHLIDKYFPEAKFLSRDEKRGAITEKSWSDLFKPFDVKKQDKTFVWGLGQTQLDRLGLAWRQYTAEENVRNLLGTFKKDVYVVNTAGQGFSRVILLFEETINDVSIHGQDVKKEFLVSIINQVWISDDAFDVKSQWSFNHVNSGPSAFKFNPSEPNSNTRLIATMFLIAPDQYDPTFDVFNSWFKLHSSKTTLEEKLDILQRYRDLFLSEITPTLQDIKKLANSSPLEFKRAVNLIGNTQSIWKWITYFKWVTLQSYQIRLEKRFADTERNEISTALQKQNLSILLGDVTKL